LTDCFLLQGGREIGEGIVAAVIVELVSPDESGQREHCVLLTKRVHEGAMLKVLICDR